VLQVLREIDGRHPTRAKLALDAVAVSECGCEATGEPGSGEGVEGRGVAGVVAIDRSVSAVKRAHVSHGGYASSTPAPAVPTTGPTL